MKALFSIIALIAVVSAQNSKGYNITSKPFQLMVHGDISGPLHICDVGANLRNYVSFCFYNNTDIFVEPVSPPTPSDTFNFNSSIDAQALPDRGNSSLPGIITWFWPVHNGQYPPIPSALYFENGGFDGFGADDATPRFQYDGPWSNTPQLFTFDAQDELIVLNSVPTKKWFLCWHNFSGLQSNMLVFGVGVGKPENKPCVAVGGVKRKFI
jgi:hypothetical protein